MPAYRHVMRDAQRIVCGRRWKGVLLASTAIVSASVLLSGRVSAQGSTGAPAQSATGQFAFDIPPQSLSSAMIAFQRVTGISVIADGSVPQKAASPGVSGARSAGSALEQMLVGTGLSYTINGSTARIFDPSGTNAGAMVEGAIALDTIDVSGGSSAAEAAADAPYQAAGSVSHISREQIDRIPPISAGDMFTSTPGVINAGNRIGTSINPNIRGMQGMGRVVTKVDGAQQTSSSYRGYIGNRDETYIDPDMIGGIDISKGPGADSGGIGGSVGIRTLEASDIVRDGQTTGARVRTTLGSNTSSPPDTGTKESGDRPGFFGDTFAGSVAMATIKDDYEGVVAYTRRKSGNYFTGTNVPNGIVFAPGIDMDGDGRVSTLSSSPDIPPNTPVLAGAEAFNTSEDTQSILMKGKVKWGDGHSLQLGYLLYDSQHGEIDELFIAPWYDNEQIALTTTRVDSYTAKYRWNPMDNALISLRANLWLTDLDVDRGSNGLDARDHTMRTIGGDISNASVMDTALGELTWRNGLEFVHEHAGAQQYADSTTGGGGWNTFGPSGVRLLTSAYSTASLKATDWLTLQGGLRYDHYNTEGEGYLAAFPKRSGGRASPDVAAIVTPFDGVQVFAKYAEGYRPPTLRESHWKYQGLLINNPDLNPEISKNIELGTNVMRDGVFRTDDRFRFKASYFRNRYDDYIVRGLIPGGNPNPGQSVYHWSNIDHANYEGVEFSASYDARTWFVEGQLNKYFTVEYCPAGVACFTPAMGGFTGASDPLKNDYNTNYIPPEYSGSVTAGVRLFDEALTLGGRMHFASVRFGSSWSDAIGESGQVGYQFTWPSYRVFDVFGSYKVSEDVTVNWSVENITDEYYYGALSSVGIPSPGRTARLSLTRTLDGDIIPTVPDLTFGRAAEGAPGSNWTGLYLGAHVGYALADMSGTTTAGDGTAGGIPATESANVSGKDPLRGGQLGFNYQLANGIVLGVEGDLSWMTFTENQKAFSTEGTLGDGDWLQAETDYAIDWMATLRGRIGYAQDRWLLFATGGLAFLKEEHTRTQYLSNLASASLPFGRSTQEWFSESDSAIRRGFTVGGGVEYALSSHWSMKGEYQYVGFDTEDFVFGNAKSGVAKGYSVNCTPLIQCIRDGLPLSTRYPGSSETTNGRKASNDLDLHTIKLGVNYRF